MPSSGTISVSKGGHGWSKTTVLSNDYFILYPDSKEYFYGGAYANSTWIQNIPIRTSYTFPNNGAILCSQ